MSSHESDVKAKHQLIDHAESFEKDHDANLSDHSSMGSPAPHFLADESTRKTRTKQKRKRLLKDVNAPKAPLTGYVRFLNEHREKFREEHPEMPFHEVTKVLGQKWTSMTQEEKQQYLEEAEKDKEKYMKALEGYQQTPAYREFQMKKRKEAEQQHEEEAEKHLKNIKVEYPHSTSPKRTPNPVINTGPRFTTDMGSQIPIFTEPFLEYCRKRESELRQLRKNNSMFEEQNAILTKQIDHMKTVMDRVKTEIIQKENENLSMQGYLEGYKKDLVLKFRNFPFPESFGSEKITTDNIEVMLTKLAEFLVTEKGPGVSELKRKAKEIVSKIDYPMVKE